MKSIKAEKNKTIISGRTGKNKDNDGGKNHTGREI